MGDLATIETTELERRVSRLESIEAIKQLQVEYGSACDDGIDADRIASLFAENGVWQGGSPPETFVGRDEVRGHFVEAKARLRRSFHYMIGPRIEIDQSGSLARGYWYLLEPATFAEDAELRSYWLMSTYDMEYVRADSDRWFIQRMTLKPPARATYDGWK